MSTSNDVAGLFARFGGHAENYQEIGRDEKARASQQRWPLLVSVGEARAVHPPAVNTGAFRRGHNVNRQPMAPAVGAAAPAVTGADGPFRIPSAAVAAFARPPSAAAAGNLPTAPPASTPLQRTFERLRQAGGPAPTPVPVPEASSQVDTLFRRLVSR